MKKLKILILLGCFKVKTEKGWVRDKSRKSEYAGNISAPFNAQDVVDHARTYPQIYDMEFLESKIGLLVITEIIKNLNDHMVPQDDFEQISMAYNRGNPHAGYNKSLIGLYASSLKNSTPYR